MTREPVLIFRRSFSVMYASFQGVGYAHFWIRFPMHENNFTDVLTWFVPRSAGCESAPHHLVMRYLNMNKDTIFIQQTRPRSRYRILGPDWSVTCYVKRYMISSGINVELALLFLLCLVRLCSNAGYSKFKTGRWRRWMTLSCWCTGEGKICHVTCWTA